MDQIDSKAYSWYEQGCTALNSHPPELLTAISAFTRAIFLCPRLATLYHHRGEAYFRLCDFHSALLNFRRATHLDPQSQPIKQRLAQLQFVLGRLFLDEGAINSAVRAFSEALELQPLNTDFWIFRIKAWIRGKNYGKALGELNKFITHPSSEEYFAPKDENGSNQDSTAAKLKKKKRIKIPTQSIASSSSTSQPHAASARSAREEEEKIDPNQLRDGAFPAIGDELDGVDAAAASKVDEESSDEEETGPLDLDANSAAPTLLTQKGASSQLSLWRTLQALILRAKLHVLLERDDLALRDAGWAHHLSPANHEVRSLLESLAQKAEFLYGSALGHLLSGENQQALQHLNRALELNPGQIKFYAMRAELLRKDSKYDDALRDLKMALNIHHALKQAKRLKQQAEDAAKAAAESTTGGLEQQTFVTASADDVDEEEKDSQQLDLEKSLALTFNGLGVQYYQDGHFSHGISCLSKAIELSPGRSSTTAAFFANRGDCHLALDETEQALSDYHIAKELDPQARVGGKIASIHAKRGRDLFNRVEYEGAESEFSRAIANEPYCGGHYLLRAKVLHVLRKYELTYRDAERAVELDPGHIEARNFLLSLRASLLRPADQARAPPLPPLPPIDQPWLGSTLRPSQSPDRYASQPQTRQAGFGPTSNGNSILQLVYGGTNQSIVAKSKNAKRVVGKR